MTSHSCPQLWEVGEKQYSQNGYRIKAYKQRKLLMRKTSTDSYTKVLMQMYYIFIVLILAEFIFFISFSTELLWFGKEY